MKCVYCERNSEEVPLIAFEYRGQEYRICTAHLPMLLHKPQMLEGRLADAGRNWTAEDGGHDH